ncbi:hypothetical protein [Nocardia alni]|uniref:hypothetical protein n=1 Tax=Nocardia alni TaxID=2815723 RepID=UPI001C24AD28|nr:hypothetical protein [Nocardia alni]
MSVMGRLLAGSAPLRGRASLELIVRPLGWGYDTSRTVLTCYSGAGFDENLRLAGTEPRQGEDPARAPMLVDLNAIYADV